MEIKKQIDTLLVFFFVFLFSFFFFFFFLYNSRLSSGFLLCSSKMEEPVCLHTVVLLIGLIIFSRYVFSVLILVYLNTRFEMSCF